MVHGFPSGPCCLCLCPRAPALPYQIFPTSCISQDYSHHNTRARAQWKQHSILSYLPFSGFPSPVRARGESCPGGIWSLSSSWSRPCPSLPLLRLIPPSSPPPSPIPANWLPGQPSWEAASYHGNPAWLPGCLAQQGQGTSQATELLGCCWVGLAWAGGPTCLRE